MEIPWLVIGIIIGVVVTWFFLDRRCKKQLAEQEARFADTSRRAEQALEQERAAHEATKQHLSEVEAGEADAKDQNATLSADLAASRKELESVNADAAEKSSNIARLQSQSDDLKARLAAADKARAQLDAQLQEAQRDGDTTGEDSRSQIANLEPRLREREQDILPERPEGPMETQSSLVQSEPEPHSEAETPSMGPADDLTKIKGIGPVLKDKLLDLGITSFQQIADFTQADIDRVNGVLDFPGQIEREMWVEQANAIVQGPPLT